LISSAEIVDDEGQSIAAEQMPTHGAPEASRDLKYRDEGEVLQSYCFDAHLVKPVNLDELQALLADRS